MARFVGQKIQGMWDFLGIGRRLQRRSSDWKNLYLSYRQGKSERPPLPAVVQIIPTEFCNLRCKMCNQWGNTGYFLEGERKPAQMPIEKLLKFLESYRQLNPDFSLSVHGGEPFLYRHLEQLLDYLAKEKIDTMFSTNGTLLERQAERLARINRHAFYLLSIDGGAVDNDKVRGKGVTAKIRHNVAVLAEECKRQKTGYPKLIINYCLSEHNTSAIEDVVSVAREIGALVINYNLRWFMSEESGKAYNRILESEFQQTPTNAWKGWVMNESFGPEMDQAIDQIFDKLGFGRKLLGSPFFAMLPKFLSRAEAKTFYHDYDQVFGIKSCIMPSYWARIHSSGELIYCPGHPDIIPGNVFEGDFETIYHNSVSNQLRKYVEKQLLPICNRCCGLYMTYSATRLLEREL